MRTLVVHYHIFKNGGTSVDRILRAAFGERWASLEGPTPTSLLRPSDLAAFARDHPGVLAVSSHLLRPPAPVGLGVLPVVLIRHPLDRAYSVYRHERRSPAGDVESGAVARRAGFGEYVLWCLDHKASGGMVIADYQVIHLSQASFRNGHIYNAVATEEDLRQAIDYLGDSACFGTVDRFDAAMARLREAAGEISLPIAAVTAFENTTDGRPRELQERLSLAREELGPALCDRFMRENELDLRLYEWACLHHGEDVEAGEVVLGEGTGLDASLTALAAQD